MMFLKNIKKAVFVGAHTDDEMLAAGTLKKLVKVGVDVQVFTVSYAAIPDKTRAENVRILNSEFLTSMRAIGVKDFKVLGLAPGSIQENQTEIRQKIYDFTLAMRPDVAFILSSKDDHQDHSTLGKICEIVMRNRVPNIIRCHFPWNFVSGNYNFFVPLAMDEFEAKMSVIRAYKSQHFRYDFEGIFMARLRLDGYATKNQRPTEAFEIVRFITGGD